MRKLTILKMVMGIALLLGGTSVSFAINEINLPIAQNPILKKVDWTKIDTSPAVAVNDYVDYETIALNKTDRDIWKKLNVIPKFTTKDYVHEKAELKNNLTQQQGIQMFLNVSKNQAHRIMLLDYAIINDKLIPELKNQLGSGFVNHYTALVKDKHLIEVPNPKKLTDKEVVEYFKLMVVTRTNVKPDVHQYIFQNGIAKGLSIPVYILPIVEKSKEEIEKIVKSKENENFSKALIQSFGGEWQISGYRPEFNAISVIAVFPNGKIERDKATYIEKQLSQQFGMKAIVEPIQTKIQTIIKEK